MALVSSVFGPIVYLLIRKNIILKLGIIQAGYWESISRISSYYLLFASTILTIYFLPKLIQSKNNQETKLIFWSYFKFILPTFIFGSILIYFLRNYIIEILFTDDFLPVNNLFFWQLIGDVFKVASLILGYQFFAKKMTLLFIISEILSLLVLYFSSIFLMQIYGIEGVVIAQAIDNFLYLIVLICIFRKSLF
jgi:O-antigen/teichoic acid export membrane protein